MEGLSKITYKNNTIIYIDYTEVFDSQDKMMQLINEVTKEYEKSPPRSVLALVNVKNVKYNMNIVNSITKAQHKTLSFIKKIAVIGVNDLTKVAYNFIVGLPQKEIVNIFDSEIEAKEWLVKD